MKILHADRRDQSANVPRRADPNFGQRATGICPRVGRLGDRRRTGAPAEAGSSFALRERYIQARALSVRWLNLPRGLDIAQGVCKKTYPHTYAIFFPIGGPWDLPTSYTK